MKERQRLGEPTCACPRLMRFVCFVKLFRPDDPPGLVSASPSSLANHPISKAETCNRPRTDSSAGCPAPGRKPYSALSSSTTLLGFLLGDALVKLRNVDACSALTQFLQLK